MKRLSEDQCCVLVVYLTLSIICAPILRGIYKEGKIRAGAMPEQKTMMVDLRQIWQDWSQTNDKNRYRFPEGFSGNSNTRILKSGGAQMLAFPVDETGKAKKLYGRCSVVFADGVALFVPYEPSWESGGVLFRASEKELLWRASVTAELGDELICIVRQERMQNSSDN